MQAVRSGEELPIAPLAAYLFAELPEVRAEFADHVNRRHTSMCGINGEDVEPVLGAQPQPNITVAQFARGYSNLTYLIGVGERELVLRRPPLGANIATAHDMGREVRVLRGLAKVYEYVPRVLLYCQDTQVIGAPFYVMERLQGVVLRADDILSPPAVAGAATGILRPPKARPEGTRGTEAGRGGDSGSIAPAVMARLASNVIDNLATIHALDYEAAGLAELGRPAGYVARQVQGWTKRYQAAQSDLLPDLEDALAWLAAHQPVESGAAIIHNDYKYDNLMLDSDDLTKLVAVLDWEMCTLGDPLLDLGTTLGYWIEAGDPPALVEMFGLTALPGNPSRAEVVERYAAVSGCGDFDPLFYYVYGLAKIGVILQQIYYRYRQGQSQDPRFARLGGAVAACGLMASAAIRQGRISGLF
jgi:aminoglycoside phosphotransferase (APT) family kinase protein